jgi:hypothetical protein
VLLSLARDLLQLWFCVRPEDIPFRIGILRGRGFRISGGVSMVPMATRRNRFMVRHCPIITSHLLVERTSPQDPKLRKNHRRTVAVLALSGTRGRLLEQASDALGRAIVVRMLC